MSGWRATMRKSGPWLTCVGVKGNVVHAKSDGELRDMEQHAFGLYQPDEAARHRAAARHDTRGDGGGRTGHACLWLDARNACWRGDGRRQRQRDQLLV